MNTTRNQRYYMKREGISLVSPIVAHGATVAVVMPQGARSVHQGGAHLAPVATRMERARRDGETANIRRAWSATGERTALGAVLDTTHPAILHSLSARRVTSA